MTHGFLPHLTGFQPSLGISFLFGNRQAYRKSHCPVGPEAHAPYLPQNHFSMPFAIPPVACIDPDSNLDYSKIMKHRISTGIFIFTILPFLTMAQEGGNSSDAAVLPDLPDVNRPSESTVPNLTPSPEMPATPDLPATPRPNRPTQEQIEKAQKDKNWLLEGLRENEAKAEAAREESQATQNSIIDEILNKNRQQMGVQSSSETSPEESTQDSAKTFQPALQTSAFDPLPEIEGSDSLTEAQNKIETTNQRQKQDWKAYDEKTGVPNVFFNTRTGTFESHPVEISKSNSMEVEWQRQQRLQKETTANQMDADIENKVLAFESQLIEQAKAQNKLPEGFSRTDSRQAMTYNPGKLDSNTSPYLFANNNNSPAVTGADGPENPLQNSQPSFTAQQGNDVALAKLRMIEEERQKRFENEQKPTILEIHTPRPTRSLEINPRFD